MATPGDSVLDALRGFGVGPGTLVGLVVAPGVGVGLAAEGCESLSIATPDPGAVVGPIDLALRPRWVVWSAATASALVSDGVRVATCWDLAAVHRLLCGGWRADPARIWARLHDLSSESIPVVEALDLFSQAAAEHDGDPEEPLRADGHLRAEWAAGAWAESPARLARWAALALDAAARQEQRLDDHPRVRRSARSESTAELLCAELATDGLPVDREAAEAVIARFVGPRPPSDAAAIEMRAARDADVLRHAPPDVRCDLRSPLQVKSLLRRIGVEVPDTRAWRLESMRDAHPLIDALLVWRKAERMETTFGYRWLDEYLGDDGRLHGAWTGCDGAAGRMTATAGLHNMPAELREAVVADPGHVFVRADLGQIEPRVLAAVAGDAALARASQADDMYAPVAQQLGVDRATAKVAVLGAMYGQTTGHGATAMRDLRRSYPVAIDYLEAAAKEAEAGRDLRTYGGRLVRMGGSGSGAIEQTEREARSRAAARGRYGRNAMVQGAAAELFKVWAVTVRARGSAIGARIVLCLHDELLVHVPSADAEAGTALVEDGLQEAAARWAPDDRVRFLAETTVIHRWSDAKL